MQIFDDKFPGNATVIERLLVTIRSEGITAFTGAGTSMPGMPSWLKLIRDLIDDAERDGRLDTSTASALREEKSDFLYVVDEIYNALGSAQAKSRVAKIFSGLKDQTTSHEILSSISFKRIMTLNYDNGLELAFSRFRSKYVHGITARHENELDDWLRRSTSNGVSHLLHWHGIATDASSIVLSGSDYSDFYDKSPKHKEILRRIFSGSSVLMIGFGFTDPFIVRELESVMQPIPTGNAHFAIVGIPADRAVNIPLERRRYSTKFKMEPIFYPVLEREGFPDHSAVEEILRYIAQNCPQPLLENSKVVASTAVSTLEEQPVTYRTNLFTIGDKQIYSEPNLWRVDESDHINERNSNVGEIVADNSHCSIVSLHENGLSNLGRRLASELTVTKKKVVFREADSFPKYKKALINDKEIGTLVDQQNIVFIMDNFSAIDHQRIIKELISTFEGCRVIILQKERYAEAANELLISLNFTNYNLRGLTRSNIRSVVNTIAPAFNSDETSSVVDKLYSDLTQLCIPLTPSNVIMYASVVCKDGNFSPVSRLHIVDKFVTEALRRASDAYADTFNSINKVDLISAFCFKLFDSGNAYFQHSDWVTFCNQYKGHNLVDFNAAEIMADLMNGRVVLREGSAYFFRYRMFFSYFVGRFISASPSLLLECLAQNRHLEIDGLVEVLCGTLPDCSIVLDDLTEKVAKSFSEFYRDYPLQDLDLHADQRWEVDKEEASLWGHVNKRLAKGPATTQELDHLKTSIQAEQRTEDQKVSIIKFIASEQTVASNLYKLTMALENTKHASAASKKAAALALIKGTALAYEVATVFIPLIAEKKYVSWNGFTYINLIESKAIAEMSGDESDEREKMRDAVAYSLPASMTRNAADRYGSRKLGQVFISLYDDCLEANNIIKFTLFVLILRSKPTGWLDKAKSIVAATDRYDLYLRHMLNTCLRQFRNEINTEAERQDLKALIAAMQLKREVNLKRPSNSQVAKAIEKLSETGYWERQDSRKESKIEEPNKI